MSDFLPEFEPFSEKIAATAKPVVRFSLKKETVELWDSKVGGRPRPLQNSLPSRQPKPKHRFSAVFAPNTS
ncbi:TPA: hypothetical protein WI096_000682 [Neisseria meningitidis]